MRCTHRLTNMYTHTVKYYAVTKKEGNPAIYKNMGETKGHYANWNKPEKDKYCMVSFICGILKKKNQSHRNRRRMMVARGWEERGG